MVLTSSPPRLLVLFQGAWEDEALMRRKRAGEVLLEREGFEMLSLRSCWRLVRFDARRFADRVCERYRGRIDAVWSNDDGFGCLLAAIVAMRLGLPGNDPVAVVRAQHKVMLREALARDLPEASVRADALPFGLGDRRCRDAAALDAAVAGLGREWPLFCKPVKGTFSALARRARSPAELAGYLRLPPVDRFVLRGLSRPFEQLAGDLAPLPCPVDRMLLEQPMDGAQVNVDGFAVGGDVRVLGIVDEWMYKGEVAGARHFAGFTYPSRHPPAVQARIRETAVAALRAIGFRHGLWNVEMFVLTDGSVRVIEVNPRSAGQFATMYREVDGVDVEGIAIALAAGLDPGAVARRPATAAAAASFVFRRFDGGAGPEPSADALRWLASAHPRARLWLEPAGRSALRREYRWFGSHRHAVLNHAAADFATLLADGDECARRLFGAPSVPLR